jgi:hypothetical protein
MNMKQLWLALPLLLVVGCGPKDLTFTKDSPKAEVPTGWDSYDKPEHGLFVAVPNTYRQNRPGMLSAANFGADSESAEGKALENAMGGGENAKNEPSPEDAENQKAKGWVLQVFDHGSRPTVGETMTQLQVRKESGANLNLAAVEARAKDQVREDGTVKQVDLPIGKAIEARAQFQNRGGDTVLELEYFVPNGGDLWIFHFASTNQPTAFDQIAMPIMQTVRIKPNGP